MATSTAKNQLDRAIAEDIRDAVDSADLLFIVEEILDMQEMLREYYDKIAMKLQVIER